MVRREATRPRTPAAIEPVGGAAAANSPRLAVGTAPATGSGGRPEPRASEAGWFRHFAHTTAETVGRSQAFVGALLVVVVWATTGPLFHFSDTWQLVINTGTTIVTFLMVFLIQNTQNRDAHAMHLKLDELIRANKNARNSLLALEDMSDDELARLQSEFEELRQRVARARETIPPPSERPLADEPAQSGTTSPKPGPSTTA